MKAYRQPYQALTSPLLWSLGLWMATLFPATAQEEIEIVKPAMTERIPISLEGYTGEVADTLKFDLEIVGFKVVSRDQAQYHVEGRNDDRVEARLIDQIKQEAVFAKYYRGGSLRSQAHSLADDIVQEVTGNQGIAQNKIAFKIRRGSTSELYAADYDGANATQITRDNSIVAAPTWAPKEQVLYYTSYRRDNPDLYAHNIATGRRWAVARYLGLNASPAVSPDGQRLAMVLSKSGSPDLYVSDRNGENLTRLTSTRADESAPTWSPDGSRIAFVSRASGRADLYSISPDGGEMQRMQTTGVYNATEPDWSPDGEVIAFTTLRGGNFELCLLPANNGQGGTVIETEVIGEDPSWAPNSRTVVFTRRLNGTRKLSLLDVPTQEVKDIRHTQDGEYSEPTWAR